MSDGSELVERALSLSKADDAIVLAAESSEVNLRWANNTLTTNGASRDRSITVISIIGRSFGTRSASVADGDALADLVRESEAAARGGDPAEDAAPLVEGPAAADFAAAAERTSTTVFAELAKDMGAAFAEARAQDRRLYGFASHELTTVWLGTSSGLRLRHTQPRGTVEWNAKGTAPGASVWHGQATRDFTDVSVPATDAVLRQRLAWCERRIELPAGRYETVIPPSAVADLLIYAYWSAAARDAAEGRTVFSKAGGGTRVGDRLAPPGVTLFSDPAAGPLACMPFVTATGSSAASSVFDNGLPIGSTDWVADGVLAALGQTRASAAATGLPVTPFADNLLFDAGGTASIEDMVANTRRGLLLTCFWYIREVDPEVLLVTGLTRDGVYLVEDGEVVGAVNNFRFNESPVDLLGRMPEIGVSEQTYPREWGDYFTLARMPPVRVPDFNMSSVSPAN